MSLYRFHDLESGKIKAVDGTFGRLEDLLFSQDLMKVKHLVAADKHLFGGDRYLIQPTCVERIDEDGIQVKQTTESVKQHEATEDLPVSEQAAFAQTIAAGIPETVYAPPMVPGGVTMIPVAPSAPHAGWQEIFDRYRMQYDPLLHSSDATLGYQVLTEDGEEFGELKELIIDTDNWLVVDCVICTRRWLPGGRELICPSLCITSIDYKAKVIEINLTRQKLEKCEDYDWESYQMANHQSEVTELMQKKLDLARRNRPRTDDLIP